MLFLYADLHADTLPRLYAPRTPSKHDCVLKWDVLGADLAAPAGPVPAKTEPKRGKKPTKQATRTTGPKAVVEESNAPGVAEHSKAIRKTRAAKSASGVPAQTKPKASKRPATANPTVATCF